MTEQEFWQAFIERFPEHAGKPYIAFQFWGLPDRLLRMVLEGRKRVTVSPYIALTRENEPMPQAGDLRMIMDSKNEPKCIIETTEVYIKPFDKMTAQDAFDEGEKSLSMWRKVYENFFKDQADYYKVPWTEQFEILCERFTVVFRAEDLGE